MFYLILVNGLSAFYFFVRELRNENTKNQFPSGKMTKIGIAFVCTQIINVVFFIKFQYIFLFIILFYAPTFILFFSKSFLRKIDESRFSTEFHQFMKAVSLGMRVGNSFRASIDESYHLLNLSNRERVMSIMELVVFSQHKKLDPRAGIEQKIYKEFSKIDTSSHLALKKIDLWVEQMERERQFRHKSGQILYQLYIQMGIMSVMYIALLCFVAKKYGLMNNAKLILLSFAIFTTGCFLCLKLGKKIKWSF